MISDVLTYSLISFVAFWLLKNEPVLSKFKGREFWVASIFFSVAVIDISWWAIVSFLFYCSLIFVYERYDWNNWFNQWFVKK